MTGPRRADQGFTLVELMVVVLIIGILITIAVPVYAAASNNAQAKACQSNQRMISGAVDLIASINGASSMTAGQLMAGGSGWYATLIPTWIKNQPNCPQGQSNYLLDTSGSVVGDQGAVAGFKSGHQAP